MGIVAKTLFFTTSLTTFCTVLCKFIKFQVERIQIFILALTSNLLHKLSLKHGLLNNAALPLCQQSCINHYTVHCPKTNLNLHLKTKYVTVGIDTTVLYNICLVSGPYMHMLHVNNIRTYEYTVVSAPSLKGFYAEMQIIMGIHYTVHGIG